MEETMKILHAALYEAGTWKFRKVDQEYL